MLFHRRLVVVVVMGRAPKAQSDLQDLQAQLEIKENAEMPAQLARKDSLVRKASQAVMDFQEFLATQGCQDHRVWLADLSFLK